MTLAVAGFDSAKALSVSKIYGRHRALANVSLTLSSGKTVVLLGPNGSGKTTLLMLFSTLSRPTSGKILFGDSDDSEASEHRGSVGLLSHSSMTYGELTALENLSFFGKMYGVQAPDQRARALLERFDLTQSMNRPVSTFSRGMLQRLGLARALISSPKLLLLDEPFTGLDRASTQIVIDVVNEHKSAGGLALVISHDLNVAAALGDEFLILKRGKQVGFLEGAVSAEALRETYAEVTA